MNFLSLFFEKCATLVIYNIFLTSFLWLAHLYRLRKKNMSCENRSKHTSIFHQKHELLSYRESKIQWFIHFSLMHPKHLISHFFHLMYQMRWLAEPMLACCNEMNRHSFSKISFRFESCQFFQKKATSLMFLMTLIQWSLLEMLLFIKKIIHFLSLKNSVLFSRICDIHETKKSSKKIYDKQFYKWEYCQICPNVYILVMRIYFFTPFLALLHQVRFSHHFLPFDLGREVHWDDPFHAG